MKEEDTTLSFFNSIINLDKVEKDGQEEFSETDEPNPKSFYAVGKLASEKYMDIFSIIKE